ncbi:hypothetical protein [Salibacterium aidingense]|nr:hypothetical protein [Salibacterium aidingense]
MKITEYYKRTTAASMGGHTFRERGIQIKGVGSMFRNRRLFA